MKLEELKNKKILILGFGKEGRDSFRFLRKLFPKKVLGVGDRLEFKNLDKKTKKLIQSEKCSRNIRLHFGKNYLDVLNDYDVIIKSPGIPFKVLPKSALKKITTQTEIFFDNCPGKVVGVTGTKGKSTTSALIYKILKEGKIKAHLVGNIGKPVLNFLFSATQKDVYVYELSSHQLYNLKKSPPIAVFLNIYPEHGDYYLNFNEYLRAKANITLYQKERDYLIFNSNDKIVRKIAKKSKAKKIPLGNYSQILKNLRIVKTPLLGKHNFLNIAAAIEVGKIFGVSKKDIKKAIEEFKPLPHRLEFVGNFKGIKFYNDSLSTIPEATIAALDSLGDDVETILLGGFDRGLDFKNLVKRILKSKIKNLILFPTTGEKIWREILKFKNKKIKKAVLVQNMRDGVRLAYQYTQKGKICLLSPASASFNLFKDYKERGNLFKKFVKVYGKKKD